MHSDATQADREKLNRGKSPYVPRNIRFPFCKPSELDAQARTKKRFSFLYISLYAIYCNTILFIFILLAR